MRTALGTVVAALLVAMAAFGFVAPSASAQDYPPVIPVDPGLPSEEILAVIQANDAVAEAANAANNGDAEGAQAAADKIAALLKNANAANFAPQTIAALQAALTKATASAAAAAGPSAAAPPLAAPALAFTGSSASLPAALGASLVGAGGLLLLWSRKRTVAQR